MELLWRLALYIERIGGEGREEEEEEAEERRRRVMKGEEREQSENMFTANEYPVLSLLGKKVTVTTMDG